MEWIYIYYTCVCMPKGSFVTLFSFLRKRKSCYVTNGLLPRLTGELYSSVFPYFSNTIFLEDFQCVKAPTNSKFESKLWYSRRRGCFHSTNDMILVNIMFLVLEIASYDSSSLASLEHSSSAILSRNYSIKLTHHVSLLSLDSPSIVQWHTKTKLEGRKIIKWYVMILLEDSSLVY